MCLSLSFYLKYKPVVIIFGHVLYQHDVIIGHKKTDIIVDLLDTDKMYYNFTRVTETLKPQK